MNIKSNFNLNNIYTQWLNRLPVAKNTANQAAHILNASATLSNTKIAAQANKVDTSIKKILYSGEIIESDMKNFTGQPLIECELFPSSLREYTINDALNYQYNKEFTIKLDDLINGNTDNIKLRAPGSVIPDKFIENLKQNGIKDTSFDTYWTTFYLNGLDEDSAKYSHSVDYIASGYVAAKQNINDNFSGKEKDVALEKLDKDFNSAVTLLAEKVSNELGAFLSYGKSPEETEKIYDSVINSYSEAVGKYNDYIKNNSNYANLNGTENEWLKKDNSYMASVLRKAVNAESKEQIENSKSEYYSLSDLEKTQDMVNEVKKHTSNIKDYESEEKIGLDFAILYLKGEAFSKYSDVSDSLKNAVSKAIENYINAETEKLQAKQKDVAETERSTTLKKEDIFSVYNKVIYTYKATGDILKSLQEGTAFGYKQHMDKTKNPQYSSLNRYGNNSSYFWQNFYEQKPNTVSKYFKPVTLTGIPNLVSLNQNGYDSKKNGIEFIVKDWNDFISKFTEDDNAKISTNKFSAYA